MGMSTNEFEEMRGCVERLRSLAPVGRIRTAVRERPTLAVGDCSVRAARSAGGYGYHSLSNPRPLPPPRQNSRPGPTKAIDPTDW